MTYFDTERFSRVDPADRDLLDSRAKLDEFEDGEEILSREHPYGWLCLIKTGGVDLCIPTPNEDLVVGHLGPGDLFGELDPATEMPGGLRHVARGKTIVRAIANSPLRRELRAHRHLVTQMLFIYSRSVSEKIRMVNDVAVRLSATQGDTPTGEAKPAGRGAHLTEKEAAWLRLLGEPLEVPAETPIVEEGDTSRSFFVIDSGEAEVRKRVESSGGYQVLARLGPLDLLGQMAFIDGKPRSASVVPVGDKVVCTEVQPDALERAMRLNFVVAFNFLGTMRTVLGRLFADTLEWVSALSR